MRNLFTKFTERLSSKAALAVFVTLIAVAVLPLTALSWGPNRATFTIEQPAQYVTFNSITNNPGHGDERNFMLVRDKDAPNASYADEISLTGGKEYVVYVYYHNNAASNYNASGQGVAKDAYARAEIPGIVKTGGAGVKGAAYVGASNANPTSVYDDVTFKNTTGTDIALRYIPGSTTIHSKGSVNNTTLADTILGSSGVKLGYNALDGVLPGCHEYAGYLTFRVKADQPNFTFKKDVRIAGTKGWQDSVTAKKGDKVEYLLSYDNTGSTQQKDVTFKDELPNGINYVGGSSKLTNASSPSGAAVGDGISKTGMNVGNYNGQSNAFLMFSATINTDTCGPLINRAAVETSNGHKTDTATVNVTGANCTPQPECKPGVPMGDARCNECVADPKAGQEACALPQTGPAETAATIIALLAITIGVVYYIRSRKDLQDALHKAQGHHK